MEPGLPGDPIRVITVLAAAVTLFLSLRRIIIAEGFMPRHVFVAAWCAHVVVFYAAYVFTGRWQPPYDGLQSWWPPIIVAHAAMSLFALQLWNLVGGDRDEQ